MPGQLIFASTPAGLAPGRSGYCTVARSRSLGERLVTELEKLSAHEPGLGEAYVFRHVRAGAETYAVLTRYADAGPDYTGRASTLAHHLVFRFPETVSAPPPADLARRFTGWCSQWVGAPTWLDDADRDFGGSPAALPATEWKRVLGDAGLAARLCDDRGAARAGCAPAASPAAALALWAEAALLTSDRGWAASFSTRDEAHDAGTLWRVGPSAGEVSPRRAVLARTGILPGAAPGAPRVGGQGGLASVRPLEAAPGWKRHLPMMMATGAGILVMGGLAWFFFAKPEVEPERVDPDPGAGKPVLPPPVPTGPSAAVAEALAAADRADWPEFARRHARLAPEERALTPVSERARRLRTRLFPDSLARWVPVVDNAAAPLPSAERTALAGELSAVEKLAAELGVEPTAEDRAGLVALRSALVAMGALEELATPGLYLRGDWEPAEETPLALTRRLSPAAPNALAAYLDTARAPVSGLLVARGANPAGWALLAEPKDLARGQILVLRHAEYGKVCEIRAEPKERTGLSLRTLRESDRAYSDPARELVLTLVDADARRLAVRIVPPAGAPAPVVLPAAVLRRTPGGAIALPAWLEGALRGVSTAPGGARALLPAGYVSAPRDYPGFPVPVAAVTQALHSRLVKARAAGAAEAELRNLESRLAAAGQTPVECGSPWEFVITPPGSDTPIPLIRFVP